MHSQPFSASSPSHHEPSKLKTNFSGESKHQTPSESQTAMSNYKKGPQRKAFFSQQEEISEDDEYANAEEQFSTVPEPETNSPYSVYQSSFQSKMPQKSFLHHNTLETLSESTKQMNIEYNKKVKINNPTPYPSGSKTKPNPTLGKPTPAPHQVHKHTQDELTEEPHLDTSTQTLVNKCLAESGIVPTDIPNVMSVSYAKRNISSHESSRQIQTHQRYVFARVNQSKHHNCDDLDPIDTPSAVPTALQAPSDDTFNPKCTHSLMEIQCNHSQYPILMKQNCTHNPSTSQVSKSYHPNPVTFPYPPDTGDTQDELTEEPHLDTSTQTLVNKCLAECGIDTTDIPNVMPASYDKRNISPHESPKQIQSHQRYVFAQVNQSKHHNGDDLDPTDTPSAVPTTLQDPSDDTYNPKCTHSLMETQCHHSQYPILMKQHCTHHSSTSQVSKSYHHNPVAFPYPPDPGEILTDDTNTISIRSAVRSATKTSPNLRLDPPKGQDQPQDLPSDVFFMAGPILLDLITPHPCPSSILMTYWGEPSSYLWMRMGRERGLPFLIMSWISVNNKSQEKISSHSRSRLMETNLMTSFHITNLWNT